MKKLFTLIIIILLLSGLLFAKEKKKVNYKKRTSFEYKIKYKLFIPFKNLKRKTIKYYFLGRWTDHPPPFLVSAA